MAYIKQTPHKSAVVEYPGNKWYKNRSQEYILYWRDEEISSCWYLLVLTALCEIRCSGRPTELLITSSPSNMM
jgi:hypothetical protein